MKSHKTTYTGLFKTLLLFSAILLLVPSNCFSADQDVVEVPDIATFKVQDFGEQIFTITGETIITHLQRAYRGQFYIQDHTGAILVDDPAGVIETEYSLYDGITGITGLFSQFQGMIQLIPADDPGEASSHNNQIEPIELTLEDLNEDIQGMLVLVRNAHFDENNPDIWTHNESYIIHDDTGEGLIRTPAWPDLLDYFGDPLPDTPKDIVGVLHQRFAVTRLLPRMSSDFIDPVDYELIPGDANCDGAVNVLDVIVTANYFAGNEPDPFCFENADVNGDGAINVMDIILTIEIFLGDGNDHGTVTDIDGNVYQTVIIGNQEWMAKNLRVTRYNNEDDIPTGLSDSEWENTTNGAYVIYDYNAENTDGIDSPEEMVAAYGKLYNWYAVDDTRGLCPAGWSVPSDDDWTVLVNYIMDEYDYHNDWQSDDINSVGNALKSCYQVGSPLEGCNTSEHPRWNSHSTHYGFDEFGFSALPGGYRGANGVCSSIGLFGYWWSSSEYSSTNAWGRGMYSFYGSVDRGDVSKSYGFSVRCLRDID